MPTSNGLDNKVPLWERILITPIWFCVAVFWFLWTVFDELKRKLYH